MCPDCHSSKKISLVLVLVILTIIGVVGSGVFASGEHDHSKHEMSASHDKMMGKKKMVSGDINKQSAVALEIYERLHEAFYNYNNQEVVSLSKQLSEKLSSISDKTIQQKLKNKKTRKYLDSIKLSENRSTNNSLFNLASKSIYEVLVSGNGLAKKYSQYYCPMVKKTWIQNSVKMTKVHNPYAPEMPHCGALK